METASKNKFGGSITALVTPFRNDKVDEDSFVALVERQISNGTSGLVPVGTTGESATLTGEEHKRVIQLCVETARGRVPVIAGAGSNATAEALEYARHAADVGADALLAVTGYYNRPSQAGLVEHYKVLSAATALPIIVYNVPARTACNIDVETLAQISHLENVVGIKDATGDLGRVARQRVSCGADFIQLSGEDITALGFNAMGGTGCISVTSNVAPKHCADMQHATARGEWDKARQLQDLLTALHDALFSDSSPAPTKYALSRLRLCEPATRLPLMPASDHARRLVDAALDKLGLVD